MSLRHHAALLPLCLGLLGTTTSLLAATAPIKQHKAPIGPSAVLTASSPQGTATITVDGVGAFATANVYTNADGLTADLSFRSQIYVDGSLIFPPDVKQSSAQKAVSTFTIGALQGKLVQRLAAASLAGGYLLEQTYQLSNPGTEPVTLNLLRYNDTDMYDPGTGEWLTEKGYQPPQGQYAYMVSTTTPTAATLTQFIGIKLSGGDVPTLRAVRYCCSSDPIQPEENNTVPNDANLDGISDYGDDMAMAEQAPVTVPAGGKVNIKVQTLLGRSALNALSDLPAR